MDYGKLTDNNGKTVDFRNVILIMTTNAGAVGHEQAGDGLRPRAQREGEDTEAIKRLFTPEFRNRLDAVIAFRGLDARDHPQRGRQVRRASWARSWRTSGSRSSSTTPRAPGWPRRATTRCTVPGRWPA